jgi:hypothetical protein
VVPGVAPFTINALSGAQSNVSTVITPPGADPLVSNWMLLAACAPVADIRAIAAIELINQSFLILPPFNASKIQNRAPCAVERL